MNQNQNKKETNKCRHIWKKIVTLDNNDRVYICHHCKVNLGPFESLRLDVPTVLNRLANAGLDDWQFQFVHNIRHRTKITKEQQKILEGIYDQFKKKGGQR